MKILITIVSFLLNMHIALADENIPANPVLLGLQLLESNNHKYLALNFKNHPEWHTYWKNPGDAGLSIETKYFLGKKEISLNALEWPIPQKFIEQGNQWAFGYINDYTHFFELDRTFQNKYFGKEITLKAKWLVCKNICVPGSKEITFTVTRDGIKLNDRLLLENVDKSTLELKLNQIPKVKTNPDYLNIRLTKSDKEKELILSYEVKNTTDDSFIKKTNMFFPFPQKPFDFTHETVTKGSNSLMGLVTIAWDGEYQTPPENLDPSGKFKRPYLLRFLFNDPITKDTYIVEKKFTQFELTNPVSSDHKSLEKKNDEIKVVTNESTSLPYYLFLAFFGGLILNVMPCVLPVISIKLFGLIKYRQQSKARILRHNIFYTLGIISTFFLLATIIIILKKFGTVVGWGFQLQSPNFIATMIIALFVFSLNLFGLFEFVTPGGSKLGNLQTGDNLWGDFLGGVLATILSTPCSAPFLGTALTFAFTSESYIIFAVFFMIGIGLAFPFILTGIYPGLVSFLPKPGNWMNTLKKLLGITLILTIFWLFDVYNTLVGGQNHLIKLLTALLFIFVGFLLIKKEKWIGRVSFLISIFLAVNLMNTQIIESDSLETPLIKDKEAKGLKWEPWSIEKMDQLKSEGQFVFIDFTAKWCFTCKVNEKLVLETEEFKKLAHEKNLKLLIGDWTKRDEVIGNFLMKNKLVGVPAYFIQRPDGTLISLGETISIEKIKSHL